MKRQGDALPAWMQAARQRGVFIQVVTVSGENAPAVKAGVMTGEAELHTLADKTRWMHREPGNTFVVAGVGGDSTPTTAERYTPESECRKR